MSAATLARPVLIAKELYKAAAGGPNESIGIKQLFDLVHKTTAKMDAAAAAIRSKADLRHWVDTVGEILQEAHTEGLALGRIRAGATDLVNPRDAIVARAIMDTESEYLLAFMNQIDQNDPRYWTEDGKPNTEAIQARSALYPLKLRGSANTGWLGTQQGDEPINWVMRGMEHCEDCPSLASLGPYTKATLFAVPGMGDTQCLFNCKCTLETRAGSAFPPFEP